MRGKPPQIFEKSQLNVRKSQLIVGNPPQVFGQMISDEEKALQNAERLEKERLEKERWEEEQRIAKQIEEEKKKQERLKETMELQKKLEEERREREALEEKEQRAREAREEEARQRRIREEENRRIREEETRRIREEEERQRIIRLQNEQSAQKQKEQKEQFNSAIQSLSEYYEPSENDDIDLKKACQRYRDLGVYGLRRWKEYIYYVQRPERDDDSEHVKFTTSPDKSAPVYTSDYTYGELRRCKFLSVQLHKDKDAWKAFEAPEYGHNLNGVSVKIKMKGTTTLIKVNAGNIIQGNNLIGDNLNWTLSYV